MVRERFFAILHDFILMTDLELPLKLVILTLVLIINLYYFIDFESSNGLIKIDLDLIISFKILRKILLIVYLVK